MGVGLKGGTLKRHEAITGRQIDFRERVQSALRIASIAEHGLGFEPPHFGICTCGCRAPMCESIPEESGG